MANVSIQALRDAIRAVDYPADKDGIVESAQQQGAPEDVLRALRSLPPQVQYANHDEVVRSVHVDVGSGPTAAQHSDPDEKPTRPGVAEHLR